MSTVINTPRDPNTLSNYNVFRTTHTTANFDILFDEKKLSGSVQLDLNSINDTGNKEVILDTSYLDVQDVKVDGSQAKWGLLSRMEPYGSALKIELSQPVAIGKTIKLDVRLHLLIS